MHPVHIATVPPFGVIWKINFAWSRKHIHRVLKISSWRRNSGSTMVRPLAKTRRRFHGGARPHEKSYTELSLKFQPGPFISWLRGLLSPGVRGVYRGEPTWKEQREKERENKKRSGGRGKRAMRERPVRWRNVTWSVPSGADVARPITISRGEFSVTL